MKITVRIAAMLLLMCVLLGGAAHAEDVDERFENKTWDEVLQQFFDDRKINTRYVAVGYYNTVTGEEHYIDPYTYRVAASLYKLPLNMYFVDEICAGNMDWDTPICGPKYEKAMEMSIVYSDNQISELMQQYIGRYDKYREAISVYMGVDTEADPDFLRDNRFTAREMIYCLRTLYDGSEKYEKIIDAMKRASQDKFFCNRENPFDVAHKYGYIEVNDTLHVNDCAVVYTTEPILIVLLSDVRNTEQWMGDLCVLMTEYAEYNIQPEPEVEPETEPQELPEVEPPALPDEPDTQPTAVPEDTVQSPAEFPAPEIADRTFYIFFLPAVLAAAAASGYLLLRKKTVRSKSRRHR